MLKRIIIIGIVFVFQAHAFGQSSSSLKKGDAYFANGSYYNATLNYEIYLGMREAPATFAPYSNNKKKSLLEFSDVRITKPNALGVFYNLGQSYRMLNDYSTAQKWYAKVLVSKTNKFPQTRLWHAMCLRALGYYKDAEKDFKKFIKDNEGNQPWIDLANTELNNIYYITQQTETRKPPAFALHKLKGDINQTEGAYAPVVMNDTLIFTSARIVDTVNKYSKKNNHVNHLFYNAINKNDSISGKSSIVKFPSRTASNEGTPSFAPSRNTLYFTRWESENEKANSAIYVSKKKNDSTWDEPVKLEDKINKPGYNSNQPFVTQDGKYLLYASDRPDGIGKYDIWAAPIDDASGAIGEPFNLAAINSKEDDKAPFYHSNSKTLVFSTNGRVGMGGFDLFTSSGDITNLQTPLNMGKPINSVKDDSYFFSASQDTLLKKAYVSSDRASQCCLEIFAIERLPKKIFRQKVDGLVSDCKTGAALGSAVITINNMYDSTKSKKISTGNNGLFLVDLTDEVSGLTIKKKGYNERRQSFRFDPELYADTTYLVELCLDKAKKINYKRRLEATVIDCDTKKPLGKTYVNVLNGFDTSKNIIVSTTKSGQFTVDLNDSINALLFEKKDYFDKDVHFTPVVESLENDTVYTITYCMEKWKPDAENKEDKDNKDVNNKKDEKPVTEITDPNLVAVEINKINVSDSSIIYFDFNKTDIKPQAAEKLDELYAKLRIYPSIAISLDISGYSDSKGTIEVKDRISRQRALACYDYMIQKGVSDSRVKLKYAGSREPVAPETINGKDNPEGRALNRRAILKVKATLIETKKK
ncbi:OmpA family protein [Parasediminibacterium sp. JCM 36343]|uniref:OmpA family protein n=1 Tax=Parasediminibacterium sp. JCM 36343 TaxID=3374279 RepID=UPI0039790BCB